MLNLIDQSNILKGYDDATLQKEMQQPSGVVPPFLLLSEISRRKDMRQRYAGQIANAAPKTTVAQDVLAAPAMPGMAPMGASPAPAPGGLAAAGQMGTPPATPGFASGGLVDAASVPGDGSLLDYTALAKRYQSDLDAIPQQQSQARALALLATGAGILSGGHSNLGQNLGAGISAGLGSYQDALKTTDARETNALRGLSDITASENAQKMGDLQYQLELRREQQVEDPNSVQNTPPLVRTAQSIETMPEGPAKDMAMQATSMQSQILDPATLDQIASQYLAGDKSVVTGFGRTAAARIQIANAIAAKANSLGMDGASIAAQISAYGGNVAGQKATGTRAAQVGIAASEANQMADIALTASQGVPRGSFVPFNQAANAVATGTSSPAMAKFVTATTSLVNAYARAVSPVGAPTDAMRQKAMDMLNTAQGPDAYAAVITQMKKEMQAALNAPSEVSNSLKTNLTGTSPPTAPAAPDVPAVPDVQWSVEP